MNAINLKPCGSRCVVDAERELAKGELAKPKGMNRLWRMWLTMEHGSKGALVVLVHHTIMDGFSLAVWLNEIGYYANTIIAAGSTVRRAFVCLVLILHLLDFAPLPVTSLVPRTVIRNLKLILCPISPTPCCGAHSPRPSKQCWPRSGGCRCQCLSRSRSPGGQRGSSAPSPSNGPSSDTSCTYIALSTMHGAYIRYWGHANSTLPSSQPAKNVSNTHWLTSCHVQDLNEAPLYFPASPSS